MLDFGHRLDEGQRLDDSSDAERTGRVYQVYFEAPDSDRSGIVYQVYFQAPDVARTGRVYQVYFQTSDFNKAGRIYQVYFTAPNRQSGTGGGLPGGDGLDGEDEVVVAFERILKPIDFLDFKRPRGKQSWGHTGKAQARAGFSAGLQWTEEYEPQLKKSAALRQFMAYLGDLQQNERVFEIAPPTWPTLSSVTGTISVAGADQTGFAIVTDGWTGTLARGDIIRVEGLNHTMDVLADVTGPGAGTVSIPINPGILVGGSPADNATIAFGSNVTIRAKIDEIEAPPRVGQEHIYVGLRVRFREMP